MTDKLGKAVAYAAMAHQDQTDKQGVAYILHPMRVAESLRCDGYNNEHQITAILHDTVEDTGVLLVDIERNFGKIIRDNVDALSRRDKETYKDYIRRCCKNPVALVVKKYDVYDNANPRRYCEGSPTERYAWTLKYIQGEKHE